YDTYLNEINVCAINTPKGNNNKYRKGRWLKNNDRLFAKVLCAENTLYSSAGNYYALTSRNEKASLNGYQYDSRLVYIRAVTFTLKDVAACMLKVVSTVYSYVQSRYSFISALKSRSLAQNHLTASGHSYTFHMPARVNGARELTGDLIRKPSLRYLLDKVVKCPFSSKGAQSHCQFLRPEEQKCPDL
uniref:Uncharacterized protein n=1 Tax=Glossina palpalis gambiensis TaxID=67801 RepID=A0A1B0AQ17_9MUSC